MRIHRHLFFIIAVLRVGLSDAVPMAYTNETEYMTALSTMGYVWVRESFEDDDAWGAVRSSIVGGNFTAVSTTNFSVRWSANNDTSKITTGTGPARTGLWGFYALPHGSYSTGTNCDIPGNCGDGIVGKTTQPMVGISGWINGSHGGKLEVSLDGNRTNPVDFPEICDNTGENCIDYNRLSPASKFFGIIEPAGFTQFEFREVEGTAEDQKFIWCDDFTIAFSNAPPPRIKSLSVSGNAVDLVLKELATRADYTLQRSLSLASNAWDTVSTFTATTNEMVQSDTGSNGWMQVFYRLQSP